MASLSCLFLLGVEPTFLIDVLDTTSQYTVVNTILGSVPTAWYQS